MVHGEHVLSDTLAAAGVASTLTIGAVTMSVEAEPTAAGVRVRTRLVGAAPATDVSDILVAIGLGAPGDTFLACDGRDVIAERHLVDPDRTRVHDAVYAIARSLVLAAQALALRSETVQAERSVRSVPAPQPTRSPVAEAIAGRYRTVRAPQPAWEKPDPSQPPAVQIQPDAWCEVLRESGDWTCVRIEDGRPMWTDGRTLVPVREEEGST